MNPSTPAAAPATEVRSEIQLNECPHCDSDEFRTEQRITVVGKVTVAIGALAVLASLALTFVYIGLITLIPAALLVWAGTLIQEDVHVCGKCDYEF